MGGLFGVVGVARQFQKNLQKRLEKKDEDKEMKEEKTTKQKFGMLLKKKGAIMRMIDYKNSFDNPI